jgi:hypothetical protein
MTSTLTTVPAGRGHRHARIGRQRDHAGVPPAWRLPPAPRQLDAQLLDLLRGEGDGAIIGRNGGRRLDWGRFVARRQRG